METRNDTLPEIAEPQQESAWIDGWIEELEERIAPRLYGGHGHNGHGQYTNNGHHAGGSGGHCGHGACK